MLLSEEGEGQQGAGFFVLGVGLTALSAVLTNVSQILQKKSHQTMMKLPPNEHKTYAKQPLWLLGFFLFCIAQALQFVAVGFAPESVVAPLGALTLVSNAIFSAVVLKEDFAVADLFGTVLVIGGSVLAVVFGPKSSGSKGGEGDGEGGTSAFIDVDMLLKQSQKPLFIIAISIFTIVSSSLLITLHLLRCSFRRRKTPDEAKQLEEWEEERRKQKEQKAEEKRAKNQKTPLLENEGTRGNKEDRTGEAGVEVEEQRGLSVIRPKSNCLNSRSYYWPLISEIMDETETASVNPKRSLAFRKRASTFFQFTYPYLGGAMSAMTLLISKCLSSLLISTFEGHSQLGYVLPYVLLVLLVLVCAFTMHWLNMGLKYFDVRFVVPTFQLFYIVLSIIMGEVYWSDFSSFQIKELILFPSGILMALVGIIFLSLSPARTSEDTETKHLKRISSLNFLTYKLNTRITKRNNHKIPATTSQSAETKTSNEKTTDQSPLLASALYPAVEEEDKGYSATT